MQFKRSSNALVNLQQTQEQMNLPALKLKQDVCARCNLSYDILQRIVKIKDAVLSVLAYLSTNVDLLSAEEHSRKVCAVLEMFYIITNEASAKKYVTLSKVIILKQAMELHVEKFVTDKSLPGPLLRMCEVLKQQQCNRFRDCEDNDLICQAPFLDPCFKKLAFTSVHKAEKAINILKHQVYCTTKSFISYRR